MPILLAFLPMALARLRALSGNEPKVVAAVLVSAWDGLSDAHRTVTKATLPRPETPDSDLAAAEALFFEGNRHLGCGDLELAETCFRDAISIAPQFAGGYANLGFIRDRRGDAAEAEACYRRSLELDRGYPETYLNLGVLLAARKQFHEAEVAYSSALMLRPDSAVTWSNLGVLYACAAREQEAEACYRTAINLDPAYATARFNLSYLLLRRGAFEEGWACFEARDWYAAFAQRVEFPRWRGESLAGRSLLVGYEGGHGDMIQFCRYVPLLKAQGAARIAMVCHPALKSLLQQLPDLDAVVSFDESLPDGGWDYWTPPLSIPYYCATRLNSIPASIPYLRAAGAGIAKWGPRLPVEGVRVGLAWRGNPRFENDADRSLPSLAALASLATVENVALISLQKGQGEHEAAAPPPGMRLIDLGGDIEDFADTAAIVAQLDLVICVDTAVAHLAGSMGKPCWILLPCYKPDWRWLRDRSDSPWYPGVVRLFRQSTSGEWADVVGGVEAALEQWVQSSEPRRRSDGASAESTELLGPQ